VSQRLAGRQAAAVQLVLLAQQLAGQVPACMRRGQQSSLASQRLAAPAAGKPVSRVPNAASASDRLF
jgi:hypothetical protein